MTRETPYNPDDPAFLLSRSLDEELSEPERQRLEDALARSQTLRADAGQFRALHRLMKRWGRQPADIDFAHHAALIAAQTADEDSEALRNVDRLLARWGSRRVALDEGKFVDAVMSRVLPHPTRALRTRLIFRLAVPLAAAAAVAVALTTGVWFTPGAKPRCHVAIGPHWSAAVAAHDSDAEPRHLVMFGRDAVDRIPSVPMGVSFGAVGAVPVSFSSNDGPPL